MAMSSSESPELHTESPGTPPRSARVLFGWMRDVHLYAGLFVSPYELVVAVNVFFLVHRDLPPLGLGCLSCGLFSFCLAWLY